MSDSKTAQKHRDASQEALALLTHRSGKRHAFLGEGALDHMFTMMMELSSQLWVVKERLYAYESIMNDAGLVPKDKIEGWTPSSEEQEELSSMRQLMLQELFRSVLAQGPSKAKFSETEDPLPPGP